MEELDILRNQVHEVTASYQKEKRECQKKIKMANKLYYEHEKLKKAFLGQQAELEDLRGEGPKALEFYKEDFRRLQEERDRCQEEWSECKQSLAELRDNWEDLKVDYDLLFSEHRAKSKVRREKQRERIKTLNEMINEGFDVLQATFAVVQPERGPLRKKKMKPTGRRLKYSPLAKRRSTHQVLRTRKHGRDIYA